MDETTPGRLTGRPQPIVRVVRLTGYGLAVAGLFVWLVMDQTPVGLALLLAGAGDLAAAVFIQRRAETIAAGRRERRR